MAKENSNFAAAAWQQRHHRLKAQLWHARSNGNENSVMAAWRRNESGGMCGESGEEAKKSAGGGVAWRRQRKWRKHQ